MEKQKRNLKIFLQTRLQQKTMKEALKEAIQIAQSGDVVLLSPACSSFDQYKTMKLGERLLKNL